MYKVQRNKLSLTSNMTVTKKAVVVIERFLCCSVCLFYDLFFAMVLLNLTCLHCLQHCVFEHHSIYVIIRDDCFNDIPINKGNKT